MSSEHAQSSKRRCVSTACVACRKRKSKVRILCCTVASAVLTMSVISVMEIFQAVRLVHQYTIPLVCIPFLKQGV